MKPNTIVMTYTRCEVCGYTRANPWTTCEGCARTPGPARDAFLAERRAFWDASDPLVYVGSDPNSDSVLLWHPTHAFFRAGCFDMRHGAAHNVSYLRDELGKRDTEIRDLLVENAKLRRELERRR